MTTTPNAKPATALLKAMLLETKGGRFSIQKTELAAVDEKYDLSYTTLASGSIFVTVLDT